MNQQEENIQISVFRLKQLELWAIHQGAVNRSMVNLELEADLLFIGNLLHFITKPRSHNNSFYGKGGNSRKLPETQTIT